MIQYSEKRTSNRKINWMRLDGGNAFRSGHKGKAASGLSEKQHKQQQQN